MKRLFLLLIQWICMAVSLLVAARFVPGFFVASFQHALLACFVIGLANFFIRPVLMFFAFPLNFVTLGLFTFVVNGVILYFAAAMVEGFSTTWLAAIGAAIVVAVVGGFFKLIYR